MAMDWNCAQTEERLSDFLDGTLEPQEHEAFAEHASKCAICANKLAQVSALVSDLRGLAPVAEPSYLAQRIIRNTLGARTRGPELSNWSGWFGLIWQPRFAMGLATVAATFVILLHATGAPLSRVATIDLNPVGLVRAGNRQAHLTYARGEKFVSDLRVVYEIRSMLATQQPAQVVPANPTAPAPRGSKPDSGQWFEQGLEQRTEARAARSGGGRTTPYFALAVSVSESGERRSL
jgi:anti-sigma factor RsiW